MMRDKHELRRKLRRARRDYSRASILIADALIARLKPGLTVAAYHPIGSEADPLPIARMAIEAGCTLAMPHVVDRATPMRFLDWPVDNGLTPGPFGLRQPAEDAAACVPDIILTPLIGFDRNGARLGQGAGFYDRAFARYPDAWRVGIAFACQEVDMLPTDSWDVPLHAIVTDKEWIEP